MVGEERRSKIAAHQLAAVVVSVLLLATVFAVGAGSIVTTGCERCHTQDRSSANDVAAAHSRIDCASCHVPKGSSPSRAKFGVYQVFGMWVPVLDVSSTDIALVDDASCLKCHAQVSENAITTAQGLKVNHVFCAEGKSCVKCHSDAGHGDGTGWARRYAMNDCVSCHKTESASIDCQVCHVGKIGRDRSKAQVFAVTHGANWRKTHGLGEMSSCSVCHEEEDCARCHGVGVPHPAKFVRDHAPLSKTAQARCETCHNTAFCTDCHGMQMPHPATFAAKHSGIVKSSGREQCARCHEPADCETCHVKHVHPGGAVGPVPRPAKAGGDR